MLHLDEETVVDEDCIQSRLLVMERSDADVGQVRPFLVDHHSFHGAAILTNSEIKGHDTIQHPQLLASYSSHYCRSRSCDRRSWEIPASDGLPP